MTLYDDNGAPVIKLDATGPITSDAYVILPGGSVSSYELLDEPGIASDVQVGFTTVTVAPSNIGSVTISTPGEGYVVVTATAKFDLTLLAVTDPDNRIYASLSRTSGVHNSTYDAELSLPNASPGNYREHFTIQMVTAVPSAQNRTFYLVANHGGGAGIFSAGITDLVMTAVYFPTAYGTVNAPAPPQPGGDTQASAEAEDSGNVRVIDYRPIIEAKQAERIRRLEEELEKLKSTVQQLQGSE